MPRERNAIPAPLDAGLASHDYLIAGELCFGIVCYEHWHWPSDIHSLPPSCVFRLLKIKNSDKGGISSFRERSMPGMQL